MELENNLSDQAFLLCENDSGAHGVTHTFRSRYWPSCSFQNFVDERSDADVIAFFRDLVNFVEQNHILDYHMRIARILRDNSNGFQVEIASGNGMLHGPSVRQVTCLMIICRPYIY